VERPRLDRDGVVHRALALADSEGLDAVTIRRLASDLGVTPMALYWHFADKQALLDALVDELWAAAAAELGTDPAVDLWDELERLLGALVAIFARHPAIAPMAPMRVLTNPAGLAVTESALELLAQAGLTPRGAAESARYMLCAAIMLVESRTDVLLPDPAVRAEMQRRKRTELENLAADRYPRTRVAAKWLATCDEPDTYYAGGIAVILGGIRAAAGADAAARLR